VHPSASIIVFTTLTGAGYGLLFWLGLGAAAGLLPPDRAFVLSALGLALLVVTGGLVSSAFHLARPERAWRAFSQWRTSWLSREGVASVATYLPALAFGWRSWFGATDAMLRAAALLTAAGAAATVVCTAYIYRSLKPIAHWSNGWVPPNYLALGAMTGALWLAALAAVFGDRIRDALGLAVATILIAAPLKLLYWRHIGGRPGALTPEAATGLGNLGRVRLFEAPHTEANYLLKEMGFAIARRHSRRLRRIAFELAFAIPLLLVLIAAATGGWQRAAALLAAATLATLGVLVERWLFFAEAKHTVMLYYGAERA
jgi:DMSO reductase anchor subunit